MSGHDWVTCGTGWPDKDGISWEIWKCRLCGISGSFVEGTTPNPAERLMSGRIMPNGEYGARLTSCEELIVEQVLKE